MHRPPHNVPLRGGSSGGGGNPRPLYYPAPTENPSAAFTYLLHPNAQYFWSPQYSASAPQPALPHLLPSTQNPAHYLQNPLGYGAPAVNGHGTHELLGRTEAALAKAHQDLMAAGESVSAWKVSQTALMALHVDSWASMGFQFQDIPYLRRLVATEGKVNAFIHCFVGVRKITTIHDLDVSICKNEGIEHFANLGLGPLLRHPLVIHYFSVPPDTTEVPNISTEDVVCCLSSHVDKSEKMISVEEFLDFLVDKHAVDTKEKLGVRIQSLGMHIACIRKAKQAEHMVLSNSIKELRHTQDNKSRTERKQLTRPPNMALEKEVLGRRFGSISKRIKSFSSECDVFDGKHTRFDTSDAEDSESDSKTCHESTSKNNSSIPQRVSSCPYPSTTEERQRLGLNSGIAQRIPKTTVKIKNLFGRKRKFKDRNRDCSSLFTLHEEDQVVHGDEIEKDHEIVLSSHKMEKFITMWKEACREHSVVEVLDMMLNFYSSTENKKKKIRKIFSSYPGVGLLNIATTSIKCGMLDSIYEIFQDVGEHGFNDSRPGSTESIEIDLPVKYNENLTNKECTDKVENRVTVKDIIQKMTSYFLCVLPKPSGGHPFGNKFTILITFHDCEMWLAREFSVDAFGLLGYGHFIGFSEKYWGLIPTEVRARLVGESYNSLLEVTVDQLQVFLSQAQENLMDNGNMTLSYILRLLEKQFPTLCLEFIGDEAEGHFRDLVRRQKENATSMNVFYSTTLLGKFFVEKSNEYNVRCSLEALGTTDEVDIKVSSLGPVSGKDAIQCLCKAPMLTDLRSWSHWDLVYAPTLGPLLAWLQNQIGKEKLSCIVTSDGRIVRIDHTATVEEFLEASIQCSPFHCALKLLSLLALHGGINNIPLALLKCFAQRAVDVIVKNSMDYEELNDQTDCFLYGSSFKGQVVPGNDVVANKFSADNWSTLRASRNKGINVAAMFILNCLEHLPSEFRIFAAEIWMSALQSSTKDSSLVMLRQCKQVDQRILLHDIGLALGIVEWIEDYRLFISATTAVQDPSRTVKSMFPAFKMNLRGGFEESSCSNCKIITGLNSEITKSDVHNGKLDESQKGSVPSECSNERCDEGHGLVNFEDMLTKDATLIVESIRREEFGLDPNFKYAESNLLKKQHARLGRALHCLSQELYSQDSHLLLELVQNADDNTYPDTVKPTLVFILQPTGIIVLNNELGFSAENIKALCDIGNSTKKGSSAGYIGHKGIGFKSVFRVTDAPEIHSNGFHVKFDISEGQIGFVLPTVIPPCDVSLFERQITPEVDQSEVSCWNTCIVLPFRSKLEERSGVSSIISMFSDLHPSLLLFLHRLQCIKLRNMLNDSLMVMKKETLGDGIIKVSFGTDKIDWLVVRRNLHASIIRPDVQTTEIAVAFTLLESDSGEYKPYLNQQPVFAFLPLRTYGLKFILQGDFVLPSSREEVDGDSAWNQWLLSEFPDLFVSSKRDFIGLPCFKDYPGKAVSAFMSFVPLAGEVHGFFSRLPHMIVSKLRTSNCLLLEGHDMEWVSPCRVIRGWDEQVRTLLSYELLQRHLGLGYLNKDIVLSDSLAKALGIREYGPKILSEIISSICHDDDGIQQLGLDWLCNWFITLNNIISSLSSGIHTQNTGPEVSDVISSLREIPFIPLSNGSYGSIAEGPIWLSLESFSIGSEGKHGVRDFPRLYAKLRIVNPLLISAASSSNMEESGVDDLLRILHKIGVQSLSAHEVIKKHIMPALSGTRSTNKDKNLMVEYLSYVMFHFQYPCTSCQVERVGIITELQSNSILLTNHGYKSPIEEPVHFGREFGNPIDKSKLIGPDDSNWNEVDDIYLKHYSIQSVSSRVLKWREFFQELGVTDFVQVIRVEKSVGNFVGIVPRNAPCQMDNSAGGSLVSDWESPELIHLLSALSLGKQRDKCMYLLEILDKMWDDYYSSGERNYARGESIDSKHPLQSSFLKCLHDFKWIASSADEELHYPKDLFYDCEAVRSLLGSFTPFAVPQVKSKYFLNDIGFKIQVTFDDALAIFRSCGILQGPVSASIAQMSNFYSFIWEQTNALKVKIMDELKSCPHIFVPSSYSSGYTDIVSGTFLSSNQVYWHDPTGCLDQLKKAALCSASTAPAAGLSNVYPNLHDFFVNECGVQETPPFGSYVLILLQLSNVTLPSETAHLVFQVFLKWSDDLNAGRVQTEEMILLTESLRKLENTVLPTVQDKWVSLHPTFGLVCWSDDEELRNQFKHSHNVSFIHFGELSDDNKEILSRRVSKLLQRIGVPSISEVVSREAIFYGTEDCRAKTCLINWTLPYAQRYLFKLHPDKYLTLKKSVIEKLALLQIAVVEKLFYRYTIKGCTDTSRKRFECSCLLQGNVLYMTRSSDSHSIFLELSRVFFDGSAELHFANFLHMVATMAESGSTEDQIEFFIVNSQQVPKLPIEEAVWSLTFHGGSLIFHGATASQNVCPLPMNSGQSILSHARKPGIIPNWPPTDWKTAPDFSGARHYGMMPVGAPYDSLTKESSKPPEGVVLREDIPCSVEVSGDWIVEDDNSATTMDRTLDDPATPKVQSHSVGLRCPIDGQVESSLENVGTSNSVSVICLSVKSDELQRYAERDTFGFQAPSDDQSRKTGSLGEAIAYKYFSEKYGTVSVKWVNEESETGLPYDLIIGDDEGKREYVEVKATRSTTKDWFHITMREWQFAAEKGEFYSIAHIVLTGPKNAKITVFKNPLWLSQQNLLHLAVVMSRR